MSPDIVVESCIHSSGNTFTTWPSCPNPTNIASLSHFNIIRQEHRHPHAVATAYSYSLVRVKMLCLRSSAKANLVLAHKHVLLFCHAPPHPKQHAAVARCAHTPAFNTPIAIKAGAVVTVKDQVGHLL